MTILEQLVLLEQKIESAVAKIQQLQTENDALRSKCNELTNAVSAKSEQLDSFGTDKELLASRIQKSLDKLSTLDNSFDSMTEVDSSKIEPVTEPVVTKPLIEQTTVQNSTQEINQTTQNINQTVQINQKINQTVQTTPEPVAQIQEEQSLEEDPPADDFEFDIF